MGALRATAIAVCVLASTGATAKSLPLADAATLEDAMRPRGRPIVLHLWASWCRPCVAEWPALSLWMRRVERRVSLVHVALDEKMVPRAPGRGLRASTEDAFAMVRAIDPAWDGALPATFVVDGEGHLVIAQRGVTNLRALADAVDRVAPPAETHQRGVEGK